MSVQLSKAFCPRSSDLLSTCAAVASARSFVCVGCALLFTYSILRAGSQDQPAQGDIRSRNSGPWNSTQTWERYDGGAWIPASACPDTSSGVISISAGHTVTIASTLMYDQLVVDQGAQVIVAAQVSHTLADGPGIDLKIDGTWLNQGSSWTIPGSARWAVNDGGVYIHNTTAGIATPLSKSILSKSSTFIYRGGASLIPASTFSGRTFGHLRLESASGSFMLNASGAGALVISGDLTIGGGVRWNTAGFSGNITVRGATSIAGEWGGAGSGNQGVHMFCGPFTLEAGGSYTLVTTGGSQGSLIFCGDVKCNAAFIAPAGRTVEFNGSISQAISAPAGMVLSHGAVTRCDIAIASGSKVQIGSHKSLVLRKNLDCSGTIVGSDSTSWLIVSDSSCSFVNNGSVFVSVRFDSTVADRRISGEGTWDKILVEGGSALKVSGSHAFLGRSLPLTVFGTAVFGEGSVITYRGQTSQDISPQRYSNLTIDNREGVRLLGTTTVDGRLTLISGSLTTGANLLSLGSGGSVQEHSAGSVLGTITSARRLTVGRLEDFGGIGIGIGSAHPSDGNVQVTRRTDTALVIVRSRPIRRSFTITPSVVLRDAAISFLFAPSELNGASEPALELYGTADGGSNWKRLGGRADTLTHALSFAGDCSYPLITLAEPFQQPAIASVSPDLVEQGTTIDLTISGSGFTEGVSDLSVSGIGVKVNSFSVRGNTSLVANISVDAVAPPGLRDLYLETPGGETRKTTAFEIIRARNPMPQLTSLAPLTGARLEPLVVTFHGNGFIDGVTTVSLGDGVSGTACVLDRTLLVVNAVIDETASLGFRNASIINAAPGGGIATLAEAFEVVNPIPRITSLAPRKAARGDCPEISVSGANFIARVTSLDFGEGIVLESLHVVSPSLMKARVRVEFSVARCTRSVTAANEGPGGGRGTLLEGLTVTDPAPRVSNISPPTLTRGTRCSVDLTGSGFVPNGMILSLGPGIIVDSVCVVDSCRMRAFVFVSRSASPGARDIILANCGPDGESSILPGALVVSNPPPLIARIDPNTAARGESSTVTLTGGGLFSDITSLDLGVGVKVGSCATDSTGGRLTASISVSTDAVTGGRDVRVTNSMPGGGEAALIGSFAVVNPVPSVTSVEPARGEKGKTLDISLRGLNFVQGATTVSLSPGVLTDSVMVLSPSVIRARISISPSAIVGARTIVVTNAPPGGGMTRLMHVFNVENPCPAIDRVEPDIVWRGERVTLAVVGSGFSPGMTTINLGGGMVVESTKVVSSSAVEVKLLIPQSAELGARDVHVINPGPGGGEVLLRNAFVVHNPPPRIYSITPSQGRTGNTLSFVLTGRGFLTGVTTVEFGEGIVVDTLSVKNSGAVEGRIAVHSGSRIGPRDITVSNVGPGGGIAVLHDGFSVTAPVPSSAGSSETDAPDQPILVGVYPNPFNSAVTVKYGLSEPGLVRIVVRNILGVEIAGILKEAQPPGYHTVRWSSSREPSGIYFLQLLIESEVSGKRFTASRKLVLLK